MIRLQLLLLLILFISTFDFIIGTFVHTNEGELRIVFDSTLFLLTSEKYVVKCVFTYMPLKHTSCLLVSFQFVLPDVLKCKTE